MNEKETDPGKCFRIKFSHMLIILLIAGTGAFVYFRFSLKSRLQARIDAIRAAGYPVTCAELDKWYAVPKNAENAAHTIIDAFWCYRESSEIESLPLIGQTKLPARAEPLPDDMKVAIAGFIADNNEALTLLHKASAMEHCRYPVDLSSGFEVQLNHLSKIRKSMMLLNLEAIWYAENNKSQSSANSVISGFSLAHSLTKEPVFVSQLVRMACYGLALSTLERVINRTTFTDEQLAEFDRYLIKAEDHSALARAYAGDQCPFLDALKKPESLKSAISGHNMSITPFLEFYIAVGLADMDTMTYLSTSSMNILKLPNSLYTNVRKRPTLSKQDSHHYQISMYC